jgi:DNA-binding Lrp family transcriptional regulator
MKNVLVVELGDAQTKKLANILTSNACQKIMNALALNTLTESELAKKLSLPLPTIHYNVQQLLKSGIIIDESYHYSTKGREVKHYKLTKQHIIITPNKLNLASELSWIVPGLLVGLVGYVYLLPSNVAQTMEVAAPMLAKNAGIAAGESTTMMAYAAPEVINEPSIATVWAIGIASAILLGILVKYIYNKLQK